MLDKKVYAKAFRAWQSDYINNKEKYGDYITSIESSEYGDLCAEVFIKYLEEVNKNA